MVPTIRPAVNYADRITVDFSSSRLPADVKDALQKINPGPGAEWSSPLVENFNIILGILLEEEAKHITHTIIDTEEHVTPPPDAAFLLKLRTLMGLPAVPASGPTEETGSAPSHPQSADLIFDPPRRLISDENQKYLQPPGNIITFNLRPLIATAGLVAHDTLNISLDGVSESSEGGNNFVNVCFQMNIPQPNPKVQQIELHCAIAAKPNVRLGQAVTGNVFKDFDPKLYIVHQQNLPGVEQPQTKKVDAGIEVTLGGNVPIPLVGGQGTAKVDAHYNVSSEGNKLKAVVGQGALGGDNRSYVLWTINTNDEDKLGGIATQDFFLKIYGNLHDELQLQVFVKITTVRRRAFFQLKDVKDAPAHTLTLSQSVNVEDVQKRMKEIEVRRAAQDSGKVFQVLRSATQMEYRS